MVQAMAVAREIERLYEATESVDPADIDTLGDDTAAGKRRRAPALAGALEPEAEPTPAGKRRLRLRAEVSLPARYKGSRVARQAVFGGKDDEGEDADSVGDAVGAESEEGDDVFGGGSVSSAAAGGFSIPEDLEKEYARMLKQNKHELEVMRAPSAADVERRKAEGKRLKQQLEAWSAMVEFRIHLEGALGGAHRLPTGAVRSAFLDADPAVAAEVEAVEAEVRALAGSLAALQRRLAGRRVEGLSLPGAKSVRGATEAAAWSAMDGQLKPTLDWALGVADDWKEKTRLDARRSFKVLDQSLSAQMQAFAETDSVKLRRRSTSGGRHSVFGAAPPAETPELPANGSALVAAEAPAGDANQEERDIYDDREFYVQLLREVLAGGGQAGDEAREAQAELASGRRSGQKKRRADVERRASKGRKIRYVPIERLQNFMAPRPREVSQNGLLGELSMAEALMNSLFAKPRVS